MKSNYRQLTVICLLSLIGAVPRPVQAFSRHRYVYTPEQDAPAIADLQRAMDETSRAGTPPTGCHASRAPASEQDPAQPVMRVSIHSARGYSAQDRAKVDQASSLLERVLNSEEFKQRVLGFTCNGTKGFLWNQGMTNEQVYDAIMSGREQGSAEDDHTADFDLVMDKPGIFTRIGRKLRGYDVVGDTDSQGKIHMNKYIFRKYTPEEVADNMAHEWMHRLGFGHSEKASPEWPCTVPYAVGQIVLELARGAR